MIAKIFCIVFLMKFASAMFVPLDYPRHHSPPGFPFAPRPYGRAGHANHPLYFMEIRNDKDYNNNNNNNELDYEKSKEKVSKNIDKMAKSHINLHESWNSEIREEVTNENGQSKEKVVKYIGQKNKTLEIEKDKHYYRSQRGRDEEMAIGLSLLQDNNRHEDVNRHHHHHHHHHDGNEHRYPGQQNHQAVFNSHGDRTKRQAEGAGGAGAGSGAGAGTGSADTQNKMNELLNKAREAMNRMTEFFKEAGKSIQKMFKSSGSQSFN